MVANADPSYIFLLTYIEHHQKDFRILVFKYYECVCTLSALLLQTKKFEGGATHELTWRRMRSWAMFTLLSSS
jgi:hypothetical protein